MPREFDISEKKSLDFNKEIYHNAGMRLFVYGFDFFRTMLKKWLDKKVFTR